MFDRTRVHLHVCAPTTLEQVEQLAVSKCYEADRRYTRSGSGDARIELVGEPVLLRVEGPYHWSTTAPFQVKPGEKVSFVFLLQRSEAAWGGSRRTKSERSKVVHFQLDCARRTDSESLHHHYVLRLQHPLLAQPELDVRDRVALLYDSAFASAARRPDWQLGISMAMRSLVTNALATLRSEAAYACYTPKLDMSTIVDRLLADDTPPTGQQLALLLGAHPPPRPPLLRTPPPPRPTHPPARLTSLTCLADLMGRSLYQHELTALPKNSDALADRLNLVANPRAITLSEEARKGLRRFAEHDFVRALAAARWGLPAWSVLENQPKVVAKERVPLFSETVAAFASWHRAHEARHVWNARYLIDLFCRLLQAAPTFKAFLGLLKMRWLTGHGPQPEASIADLISPGDFPLRTERTYELGLLLRAAKPAAVRCVRRCPLDRMQEHMLEYPALQGAVREAAAHMHPWREIAPEACLSAIEQLGFAHDAPASEALLTRFTAEAQPQHLAMYPQLLQLLRLGVGFTHVETSKAWVERVIHHTDGDAADGVVWLIEHLLTHWPTWSSPALATPLKCVRLQVRTLHKRPKVGGGGTLLQAVRRLGEVASLGGPHVIAASEVWQQMLQPAIDEYLRARCDDGLSCGARARDALGQLATVTWRGTTVPHALAEEVLLMLLGVIEATLPTEAEHLLLHLLTPDQGRLWPALLRTEGADRLFGHPALQAARDALTELGDQLHSREVLVGKASTLLRTSAPTQHGLLLDYLEAVGRTADAQALDGMLESIRTVQATADAVVHFLRNHCAGAEGHAVHEAEVVRVQQLHELPLNVVGSEKHWGAKLPPAVRDAAEACFQLRSSQLFQTQWERAKEAEGAGESPSVTVLASRVFDAARASFEGDCKRMLDDADITVGDVRHILGDETFDVDAELRLMFPGHGQQRQVEALRGQLRCFGSLLPTLRDASAVQGLVRNICSAEQDKEESQLEAVARSLLDIGRQQTQSLRVLTEASDHFYRLLQPHPEALAAAGSLSDPAAAELLAFLRGAPRQPASPSPSPPTS